MANKVVVIVLDGVGVGEAPDAALFADAGSDSVGNAARLLGRLALPHLGRLGLGHLTRIPGTPPEPSPVAAYGRLAALSAGKDSTSGHWELCGLVTERAFPTYPNGFPPEVTGPFERAIGREVLGNCAASGTEILNELGAEHHRTGRPIVYTSADSVFQIAAHEDVVPVAELYRWCEIARTQLVGEHRVGRVIARPFTGSPGAWVRTARRRDYAVPPPGRSLLQLLQEAGRTVVGIGKIEDLFSGIGLTQVDHTTSNDAGMRATLRWWRETAPGSFVFTNLNDFDTLWGHRNDVRGYVEGLQAFDAWLPELLAELEPRDLLMVTGDHGNDPTTPSTDHSREYVPILAKLGGHDGGVALGDRLGFVHVAATVLEHLGFAERLGGRSFRKQMGPL
jgi:phosphopentomutase